MKLYKLTDRHGRTHGNTCWRVGKTVTAGEGAPELCTNTVIHAYTDPYLALIMNPLHANFDRPRLYEASGEVVVSDGTKVGVKSLTLTRRLKVPSIRLEQLVAFAIYCALGGYDEPTYVRWANAWLDGSDRSTNAAGYAARAANSAVTFNGASARGASARAAYYAARAARAAYYAARAANSAAYASDYAAYYVARAANAVTLNGANVISVIAAVFVPDGPHRGHGDQ